MKYPRDLTGMRFGRLVVIEKAESVKDRTTQWKCKCDCGNEKVIRRQSLLDGKTKSCGCLLYEAHHVNNRFEIKDDYVIIYTSTNKPIKVSLQDYHKVRKASWYVDGKGYARAKLNGKLILMHRLITEAEEGKNVDHINGDPSDNRRENLRICTQAENLHNRKKSKNNTSGHKGVSWSKTNNRWRITITNKGKLVIKYAKDFEKACKIHEELERKLYGEFASISSRKTV